MKKEYKEKTKEQLINDLVGLRQRIAELEKVEAKRKRAEEALRESEERYRSIFESIQDVYAKVAMDGTILEISPSIQSFSGYAPEEVLGRSLAEFYVYPEQRVALLERLRLEGSVNDYEVVLRHKTGRAVACSFTVKVVTDAFGTPVKIVGTMRDVTERKQAEEELRESEERFSAIFEDAEDAIFTKDQKGNYTLVNPACASLFKLHPEEIIGKTDFDLFPPEVAHHIKEEIDRKVLENGEVVSVEDTKPTAGVMRTFHAVKVPLRDANGVIVGLCGIARDITELKKKTEAMKRFNKLAVGRELKMIELKKEINALLQDLGKEPRYKIASE